MRICFSILLVEFVLLPACLAADLRILDQDAGAAAKANAVSATADNASAVYYNPAALTQLHGHSVRLGVLSRFPEVEHTAPNGEKTASDNNITLPTLFYSYSPSNFPVSFGLGVFSPFYADDEWPYTAPTSLFNRIYRQHIGVVNPVLAIPFGKTLSIGGGPAFHFGDYQNRYGTTGMDTSYIEDEGDGTGKGLCAGLFWMPHSQHSFGINYRSETRIKFKGTTRYTPGLGFPLKEWNSEFKFTIPSTLTFAYCFRPTTSWTVEADIDRTDWSSYWRHFREQDAVGYSYALGVSRNFKSFSLSGGYRFSPGYGDQFQPAYEAYRKDFQPLPISPETDHHIFTVGIGKKVSNWSIDLAYQYDYGLPLEVRNSPSLGLFIDGTIVSQSLDGEYRPSAQAVMVSIGRTF